MNHRHRALAFRVFGIMLSLPLTALAAQPREMGLLPEPTGDLLGYDSPGDVPEIPADAELVVQKVRPIDCRVVLAFVHSPVDGRIDSWGYNGVVNEYDDSQGYNDGHWQNVTYEYLKNPGVHVTLADDRGFNYLVLRGGFQGAIYRGVDAVEGPGNGALVAQGIPATGAAQPEHALISRKSFPQAVATQRVSFFKAEDDRLLSDAAFYRIGDAAVAKTYTGSIDLRPGDPIADVTSLGLDFQQFQAEEQERHPSNFLRRFPRAQDQRMLSLRGEVAGQALPLEPGAQVHLISNVLPQGTPIGAARVNLKLDGAPAGNIVTLAVQDPLVGNQELMRIDVRMGESGRVRCLLDFPDQVIGSQEAGAGARFWITIASQHAATVTPDSSIQLLTSDESVAREEHLAWRLFLVKGQFYVLSEARPWTGKQGLGVRWLTEYDGGSWEVQRLRPALLDLFRTLEHIRELEPDHPVAVKQYLAWMTRADRAGIDPDAIPSELHESAVNGVPRWAVLLDRAVRTVVEIPDWWITHRMAPNGEMGGMLSDDTDMVQWWPPMMMLDDQGFAPKARRIFTLLAGGVLDLNLRGGINIRTTDALHAYEEGQNQMCIMPLAYYGDPKYVEWLMESARHVDKWLYRDDAGRLKFRPDNKSFGYDTAINPPATPGADPGDGATLLLHSHLMLAWYNRNPHAIKVLCDYADPAAGNQLDGYGGVGIQFAAYYFSGDPKYLYLTDTGKNERGNWWARFAPELVMHGKEARQQPWWNDYADAVFRGWEFGDWAWATKPDRDTLCKSLEFGLYGNPYSKGGGAARYKHIWTEAQMYTDRIFLPIEPIAQAMLGGYSVRNRIFPTYAVSYENLFGDFAALVLDQGRDRLKLAMINLRDSEREGAVHVWQLDHGKYELTIGPDTDDDGTMDSVATSQTVELARMSRVPVTLPPRRVMIYEFRQVEKLDDLYQRPDLAIGASDVQRDGDTLIVTVHNIGSSASGRFAISSLDGQGKVIASVDAEGLEAPTDLLPRTVEVRLPAAGALRVAIDAADAIAEITEINNAIELAQ